MRNPIEAFKAIGDQTRFRALRLMILAGRELCACELIDALEKPQYAISKALGVMVDAELIDERRDGRMMFYSLNGGAMNDALFDAVRNVPETDELAADAKRLKARLSLRENDCCTMC
jgi:ArsR family transcriptional regulator